MKLITESELQEHKKIGGMDPALETTREWDDRATATMEDLFRRLSEAENIAAMLGYEAHPLADALEKVCLSNAGIERPMKPQKEDGNV